MEVSTNVKNYQGLIALNIGNLPIHLNKKNHDDVVEIEPILFDLLHEISQEF